MERKIGEIFEYNGEWYQCIIGNDCENCAFNERKCYTVVDNGVPIGDCCADRRKDNKDVIFKKLEKVGEPYAEGNSIVSERMFQKYRTYEKNFFLNERDLLFTSYGDIVSIEIKQTKEDMEEKKLNLKPFDIQKAREGKPVCTRDGRKARIICFDRRFFYKNVSYPILALVERSDGEDDVCVYNGKGKVLIEDGAEYKDDLMMLPEKKEMWINIYNGTIGPVPGGCMYDTEEDAKDAVKGDENYVTTIKVCWEE